MGGDQFEAIPKQLGVDNGSKFQTSFDAVKFSSSLEYITGSLFVTLMKEYVHV